MGGQRAPGRSKCSSPHIAPTSSTTRAWKTRRSGPRLRNGMPTARSSRSGDGPGGRLVVARARPRGYHSLPGCQTPRVRFGVTIRGFDACVVSVRSPLSVAIACLWRCATPQTGNRHRQGRRRAREGGRAGSGQNWGPHSAWALHPCRSVVYSQGAAGCASGHRPPAASAELGMPPIHRNRKESVKVG